MKRIFKYILLFVFMFSLTSCKCKKDKFKLGTYSEYISGESVVTETLKYVFDDLGNVNVYELKQTSKDNMTTLEYHLKDVFIYQIDDNEIVFSTYTLTYKDGYLSSKEFTLKYESKSTDKPKYRLVKASFNGLDLELNSSNKWVIIGAGSNKETYKIEKSYNGYPVSIIKEGAFSNERNLKELIIPDSIEKIEKNAFNSSSTLTLIFESETPCKISTLSKDLSKLKILVPRGRREVYKVAWKEYKSVIEEVN